MVNGCGPKADQKKKRVQDSPLSGTGWLLALLSYKQSPRFHHFDVVFVYLSWLTTVGAEPGSLDQRGTTL